MIEKLIESFRGLGESAIEAAPRVVAGIVLFVVALVVAKLTERLLGAVLRRLRVDELTAKIGIDSSIQRLGIRKVSRFVPRVAYYLLLFLLAKTASDAIGLVAISDALGSFLAYVPNLLAAATILVLGSAAGQFAATAVTQAAESSGIEFAGSLGRIVSALILFLVGIMAFAQLKLDTEIVRLVTACCLAALALAFGLSFGLGTRDITRNILAGFYARKLVQPGHVLEIRGEKGTLKAVTPTHVLLEDEDGGRTVSIANSAFLEEVASERRS